jgi:hypothetical protein
MERLGPIEIQGLIGVDGKWIVYWPRHTPALFFLVSII